MKILVDCRNKTLGILSAIAFLWWTTSSKALADAGVDITAIGADNRNLMKTRMANDDGFLAALDQSGGSTPKALSMYGYPEDQYVVGDASMFDAVHDMRSRIITSSAFQGDSILGAILFEKTMERQVLGQPVAEYLWKEKKIVPFLKVDKGLCEESNGVQLMKPIPELDQQLKRALEFGIFGTKMRSVIKSDSPTGIEAIVKQQFEIGSQILKAGLIPIIEPEVDISSPHKQQCEEKLLAELLKHLDDLGEEDQVILKLSLPTLPDFYKACIEHPQCLRVVALSGGYSQEEATRLLRLQPKMIASFSRALTEGLTYNMSDDDFNSVLSESIESILAASKSL